MTLKDVELEIKKTLKRFKDTFISSEKDFLIRKLEALYSLENILKEGLK
jgi:hypothetical protein